MPRRIVSNSFVSGEISPELYGRHDLKAYFNGAARLENFIVRRTGGIRKRAGTDVLMTIDAEAAENAGTLDNRFKIYPYYFDADAFGVLVFRITDDGVVQSRLAMREGGATSMTDWANVPVPTGITETAHFNNLQCKQVGDTLFFTNIGFQSFKCVITKATLSTDYSMIDNAVSVPSPAAITATASGFETTSSHKTMVKEYALYGVKNGILSKPATTKANGTTPWFQGATITVRGTMDFSVHDYYILAKKTGMNFGKISEIYPVEQTEATVATLVDHDIADEADGNVFSQTPAQFTKPAPSVLASSKPTMMLTPKAMLLKTSSYDDGGTTKYRAATPHFRFNIATPTALTFHVSMRPYAVRSDTLSACEVTYASKVLTITPFYYSPGDANITLLSPSTITTSVTSYFKVSLGTLSGDLYIGLIIETADTYASDFIPIGVMTIDKGPGDYPEDQIVPTEARSTVISELELDANASRTESVTTHWGRSRTAESYWITTAWNTADGLDIYALTELDWNDAAFQILESMTLPAERDFHTTSFICSFVEFTVSEAQKKISSMSIHLGAKVLPRLTGDTYEGSPKYITATLYAVDGDTEVAVTTFNIMVESGLISTHKINISYGDLQATTRYKLVFDEAIITRGIELNSVNTKLEFVDDNVVPSSITGQQDMLTVGDKNMDCATFDVHQQRSMFASSTDLPFTLWFSAVGDLQNFYVDRPQSDDNAFSVTIPAKRASKIIHVLAGKDLMLFTEDGVYVVGAEGGVLSYRTIQIRKVCDAAASATVAPIQVDTKVLYVGEDGRTVFELAYNLMEDAITPTDMTIQAYHMTESARIVKMVYQRYPDGVVWCMLTDGSLIGMTYLPEHEVFAWHRHTFADTDDARKLTDIMDVGSVVSGSGIETTSDILLVFTTADKTIIEKMRPNVCDDIIEDADTAACIDHCGDEDAEVAVNATLITLRPESPEVSSQGVPKRVVDVCIRLRRSATISVKPYEPNLPAVSENKATVDGDGTVHLYSGDIKIMPRGYINNDGQIQIESSDNLPCEILSAVYTMDSP